MTPRRPSERPTSGDTRIATVAAGGPPVQGVGVGQADVTAYLTNVPVNAGQICAATDPSCPPPYNPEPTGGVSVTPTVSAQCNSATLVMTGRVHGLQLCPVRSFTGDLLPENWSTTA